MRIVSTTTRSQCVCRSRLSRFGVPRVALTLRVVVWLLGCRGFWRSRVAPTPGCRVVSRLSWWRDQVHIKRSLNFDLPTQQKQSKMLLAAPLSPLSPSSIKATEEHATITGVLTSLSPIRPTRYFDGELTDGESVIRVVGFNKRTREQLRSYAEYQIPLTLKDCLIQKNKFKEFLEVVIKSHTKIEASKVKLEISDIKTVGSTVIKLNQIDEYSTDEPVTVRMTVLKVNDPQSVGGGKMKQDVVIADDTAKTIMTHWDTNIGLLKPLKSYQLNRLIVKAYQGNNQLSFPSVSSIDEIEDIEDVIEQFTSSEDEGDECLEAITVSGIRKLETVYLH